MKKLFTILVVLALSISLFCTGATEMAEVKEEVEETEETEDIVVYIKVPSGWEYTTIWAWENESGKNAFSDFTEPRITSVDMNMYEIGEEAGSILIKNLAHPNLRIQTFTSEPCIFERETT